MKKETLEKLKDEINMLYKMLRQEIALQQRYNEFERWEKIKQAKKQLEKIYTLLYNYRKGVIKNV